MAQLRCLAVALVGLEPAQQLAVSDLLKQEGYSVVTFAGAGQAVAALSNEPPDLFVGGLTAPDLEGWRLCRLVRSSPHVTLSQTPILLLSGTLIGEEAERITAALGGDGLLPLPLGTGRFAAARDITAWKRAAEEKEKLQLQLARAQKMESIGRPAGGVAHDFNSLLTVINGYSAVTLRRMLQGDPARPPRLLKTRRCFQGAWGSPRFFRGESLPGQLAEPGLHPLLQQTELRRKHTAFPADALLILPLDIEADQAVALRRRKLLQQPAQDLLAGIGGGRIHRRRLCARPLVGEALEMYADVRHEPPGILEFAGLDSADHSAQHFLDAILDLRFIQSAYEEHSRAPRQQPAERFQTGGIPAANAVDQCGEVNTRIGELKHRHRTHHRADSSTMRLWAGPATGATPPAPPGNLPLRGLVTFQRLNHRIDERPLANQAVEQDLVTDFEACHDCWLLLRMTRQSGRHRGGRRQAPSFQRLSQAPPPESPSPRLVLSHRIRGNATPARTALVIEYSRRIERWRYESNRRNGSGGR